MQQKNLKYRKLAFGLIIFLLVAGVAALLIYLIAEKQWADEQTWSAEERLILPKEHAVLKIESTQEPKQPDGTQKFTFVAEYCYLYEIAATKDSANIKCSLLPMYYAERAQEVPKDWHEKSDIFIDIKLDDPEPAEFLGRMDKSFASVSALGAKKYPVEITLEGQYRYPEGTMSNKLEHLLIVLKRQRQPVHVNLTQYSVTRLDTVTPEQKRRFVEAKVPQIWAEVEQLVEATSKTPINDQVVLDSYGQTFGMYEKLCKNLSTCEMAYGASPGDQLLYYWYATQPHSLAKYNQIHRMMKRVYPFVARTEIDLPPGEHWTEITTGMFPVCPIKDVERGAKSTNAEYLFARAGKSLASYIPANATAAAELLDGFSPKAYIENVQWELDTIRNTDAVCYFVLANGVEKNRELAERLISQYYEMVSTQLGVPITKRSSSFDDVIYQSAAFSPYRTNLVLDYAILRDREVAQDPAPKATEQYTDLRSLFSTLILLYLYEK